MQSSLISRGIGYADLALQARKLKKGDDVVRSNARKHLAARMGKLRGLPQKIGQILSMSGDEQKAADFADLTDNAEPLPFAEIEAVLNQAWGRTPSAVLKRIDENGLAASLGQVHRAQLHDGREVAVKVQYPDIRQAIMNDLKMLGWLSVPLGDLRRGFDLADYRREIMRDLEEELDYRREAQNQLRFRRIAAEMSGWIVPDVVTELSGDKVLVSEWIEGERIDAATQWPDHHRATLAKSLLDGFLHTLFRHGVVHADPHHGNYRFVRIGEQTKVVLYDFGSVAPLSLEHRVALLKLIEMTASRRGDPYSAFAALGFRENLLIPIRGKLAALCTTLFEPFCQPSKYDLSRWNRSERADGILGSDRWNFRLSGPAHLILLMRAFSGLIHYLEKLRAPVAWSIALRPHLAEHAAALSAFDSSAPPDTPGMFSQMARLLRLSVNQNGREKVSLSFPVSCVDDLGSLMDDDLARQIESQGISLADVVHRARSTAYRPQELFTLQKPAESKSVRVWLE